MCNRDRNLSLQNIDFELERFLQSVEEMGNSIQNIRGWRLLEALKRHEVKTGPYPDVSLFEAANRIMTDLVILYGVKWLLDKEIFPFSSYQVEFGHEDKNGFDIKADNGDEKLVGEAFNVATSFFQGKKRSMLNKIRENRGDATFSFIMFNHDAISAAYKPHPKDGVSYIFVNVGEGSAEIVPLRPTA